MDYSHEHFEGRALSDIKHAVILINVDGTRSGAALWIGVCVGVNGSGLFPNASSFQEEDVVSNFSGMLP